MSLPTLHNPITALTDKHRALMAAMVYGLDGAVAKKHGLEPGKALGPQQCADHFHVRRAYIRTLLADPLFKAEMSAALTNKRLAYAPEAVDRIATAMRNEDDAIGLRAAVAMLGETTGGRDVAVSVQVNNQTNVATIRPGYVVRLPADLASSQTPTIDTISAGEAQHTNQPQS